MKKIFAVPLLASALALFLAFPSGAEMIPDCLTVTGELKTEYAECFSASFCEGGYTYVRIMDEPDLLIVPEDGEIPEGLPDTVTVLQQPLDHIYLAATSAMDFFSALDRVDHVRLSSMKQEGWFIEDAVTAMENGEMLYAGKYNTPDYELLLSEGCTLAIESTMIGHNPEVRDMLEQFGIPVIAEHSSYESHPLGRMEWIKFYGLLLDRNEEADAIFREETAKLDALQDEDKSDQTVCFFYINSSGLANVRKSGDYISRIIALAGGEYVFNDLGSDDENALSTVNMSMEEFYAGAKDSDYLIYNSTIDGELKDTAALLDKNPLLADFKAVQEGKAFCTTENLFQEPMGMADLIVDVHRILTEEDPEDLNYLYRIGS